VVFLVLAGFFVPFFIPELHIDKPYSTVLTAKDGGTKFVPVYIMVI